MFTNLIQQAYEEGMKGIVIAAMIKNAEKKILLIGDQALYGFPAATVKEKEGVAQALERAVAENTKMALKNVNRFVGHYDLEGARHYHFEVEVNDPYALEENANITYAWLDVQEAVGYPIKDEVREMLDLYKKT